MKILPKLLIIIGISIIIFSCTYIDILINEKGPFILENNDVIISIKKINIERKMVFTTDVMNTMKNDIALYHTSSYPNVEGSMIILAHSGNVSYAYFKNLDKLELGDIIDVFYKGVCYRFIVNQKKYVSEREVQYLDNDKKGSKLVLITCKKGDNTKRLVINANNLL